jgi:hypothetical protein
MFMPSMLAPRRARFHTAEVLLGPALPASAAVHSRGRRSRMHRGEADRSQARVCMCVFDR